MIGINTIFNDRFDVEVAMENIPGQKIFLIPGRKNSISSAVIDDLSQIPSTTVIPDPGGIQLELISDNDEDGGAGSDTGALTVDIQYLDSNGDEQVETVTMNGTTAAITTTEDIDKVQWIHVVTVGANTAAVGNISLQTVGGGTVYEYIEAGGNQSLSGRFTIPNGKTGILLGWHASGITKRIDVKLRANVDRFDRTLQSAFNFQDNVVLDNATSPWIPLDQKIPTGATVKISAKSSAAGGDASGMFKIKIIDN